jgi:hypothetical protein
MRSRHGSARCWIAPSVGLADPKAAEEAKTVAVPVPVAPPEVKVADEAIPTTEDFEAEAVEKVTDKSYKAELATLKKDIEGGK